MHPSRGGRSIVHLVASLLLVATSSASAAEPNDRDSTSDHTYVDALAERALAEHLADTPQWRRLGHWVDTWRGPVSEADGPAFFLAADGARDPAGELEATLRGFFEPPSPDGEPEDGPPHHALCRFPARFLYLGEALSIDVERLPRPDCTRFRTFLEEMQPHSVTLVFSSYFINNPASALGHTFLRINRTGNRSGDRQYDLLDYGIDYSATVDTSNSVLYAFKGVTGLFPGTFRRMPYYYKVRQYADFESRDLWEYDLALSPAQLRMLIAHIWELGSTYFDYYYLTENCSYHILAALAAAAPDQKLLEDVDEPVLPADTVRIVTSRPGLVSALHYRPSLATRFAARAAPLSREQRRVVADLFQDAEAPMPDDWSPDERAAVLDAAADWVDLRHTREIVEDRSSEWARHKDALLARRARIRRPSPPLNIPIPRLKQPDLGHASRRIGIGPAIEHDGTASVTFDLRVALHDLGDPALGYPDLAEIQFLPVRFRITTESSPRFILEDAAILRVVSLNSVDRFDLRPSWMLNIGARTVEDDACDHCVAGNLRGGGGFARAMRSGAVVLFSRVDAELEAGDFEGIGGAPVRFGIGPVAGARFRLTDRLTLLGQGEWLWLPHTTRDGLWRVDVSLRQGFSEHLAIGIEGHFREDRQRGQLMAFWYF